MSRITAQGYRANARQCLAWAEAASDPENREAFFDLAATWEAAALRIEHSEFRRRREPHVARGGEDLSPSPGV
mgnify:CR=1 FL=1